MADNDTTVNEQTEKIVHKPGAVRLHEPGDIEAHVVATRDNGNDVIDGDEDTQEFIVTVTDKRWHTQHKLKTRYEALFQFRQSLLYNNPTWRLPPLPPKEALFFRHKHQQQIDRADTDDLDDGVTHLHPGVIKQFDEVPVLL